MKYTKYFSGVLRNQGVPNLDVEQYAMLMNIVSLEGRLQELLDLKDGLKGPNDHYKFDVRIHRLIKKIKDLTSDNSPEDVLQKMLLKSN